MNDNSTKNVRSEEKKVHSIRVRHVDVVDSTYDSVNNRTVHIHNYRKAEIVGNHVLPERVARSKKTDSDDEDEGVVLVHETPKVKKYMKMRRDNHVYTPKMYSNEELIALEEAILTEQRSINAVDAMRQLFDDDENDLDTWGQDPDEYYAQFNRNLRIASQAKLSAADIKFAEDYIIPHKAEPKSDERDEALIDELDFLRMMESSQEKDDTDSKIGPQAGDEEPVEMASFERLEHPDDIATRDFRSPQSSYSFSTASDNSDVSAITKESLLELFSSVTESCKTYIATSNVSDKERRVFTRIGSVLWFLFFEWPKADNLTEKVMVVTKLVASMIGIDKMLDTGSWLVEMFKSKVVPQSGNEAFDLNWLFNESKAFLKGDLYKRLLKFGCALVTLAVATGCGINLDETKFKSIWRSAKIFVKQSDLVGTIVGFLSWLVQSGYDLLTGKISIHEFFTKPSEMQMFDTRVAKLDYFKNEIEAGREDECTFLAFGIECQAVSKFATELAKVAPKNVRLTLANQIRKIDGHWTWYKTKEASEPIRRAPYSVLFVGQSSVAKSAIMPHVILTLQKNLGLDCGPEFVFDYNSSDEYMTGFSNRINAIQLDDCANTNPQHATKQISTTLIDIINNNKRTAVMADLDSKGQYLIKPDIVVGTTNNAELFASTTSYCKLSILRRFKKHVVVRIKEEFATVGGMLKKGVDPLGDHRMDIWEMDMYEWEAEEGTGKAVMTNFKGNMSYREVLLELIDEAKKYKVSQAKLVENMRTLKNVPLCQCGLFANMCKICPDPSIVPHAGIEILRRAKYQTWLRYERVLRFVCAYRAVKAEAKLKAVAFGVWSLFSQFVFTILAMLLFSFSFTASFIFVSYNLIFAIAWIFVKFHVLYNSPLHANLTAAVTAVSGKCTRRSLSRFAGLVVVVGLMHAAYKTWRNANIKPQGGAASVPGVSDYRNIYQEPMIRPMPLNFDMKTASTDQIVGALEKRMWVGRFLEDSNVNSRASVAMVVPICSECVLIQWHIVRDNKYKYLQLLRDSTNVNNSSRLMSIEGLWQRINGTDYCILKSPTVGDQKDIRCWFPPGSISNDAREKIVVNNSGCRQVWLKGVRSPDSPILDFTVTKGQSKVNVSSSQIDIPDFNLSYWGGKYMTTVPTWDGMCGAPIVTDRMSGPYIIGFHSAGSTGTNIGRFSTIGRDDINNTLKAMEDHIVPHSIMHEEGDFVKALDFKDSVFKYTKRQPPRPTSPYIRGSYDILGNNTAPQRSFRSNVQVTIWSSDLASLGYPREHEAPQLINSYVPWNMFMTNVSAPSMIEAPYLKMGRDDYIQHIAHAIDTNPDWNFVGNVQPMEHYAVLSGLDGVRGVDPINRKTSMNIPICKPKSQYLLPIDKKVPGISYPVEIEDWLKKDIQKMEDCLKSGTRAYVAHRCNLKDEAVKIDKLKVRVFMGCPFAYLYLMRKYFLPMVHFIQEHPLLFETAVGINCYGPEWTRLRNYLTKFGEERIVAGDYKAYDQKMEIALTKAAFEVLLFLCKLAGYDEDQMTVCRGLMTETIAGCYDVKGEWIGLTSANPSGHSLTVIINSIANSIQVRAGFYKLAPGSIKHFADYVSLSTYGDDNIMGVHESIPWFNHTTLATVMDSWGITYTMADKDAKSIPYIDISQGTFLKRSWVWCSKRSTWMAPLEHSSIMKTLHTYVASKSIDVKEQHAELLISANREYFMYGYETFREQRALLLSLAQQADIMHYLPKMTLPDEVELDKWIATE